MTRIIFGVVVQALLDAFERKWRHRAKGFIKYFQKYTPLPMQRKWAMCFRRFFHALADTNMNLESWHAVLKVRCLLEWVMFANRDPPLAVAQRRFVSGGKCRTGGWILCWTPFSAARRYALVEHAQ
jgi:hypothetical protein